MQLKIRDLEKLKGDKYSRNLRLWIKKHSCDQLKCLWVKWDNIHGLDSVKGSYYLIFDDELGLTGAELRRITVDGAKAGGCYIGKILNAERKDVTDWFIKNYIEKGACLIHDFNHEFVKVTKNSRKCKYCGKFESRSFELKRINKRVESWV